MGTPPTIRLEPHWNSQWQRATRKRYTMATGEPCVRVLSHGSTFHAGLDTPNKQLGVTRFGPGARVSSGWSGGFALVGCLSSSRLSTRLAVCQVGGVGGVVCGSRRRRGIDEPTAQLIHRPCLSSTMYIPCPTGVTRDPTLLCQSPWWPPPNPKNRLSHPAITGMSWPLTHRHSPRLPRSSARHIKLLKARQ